MNSQPGRQLHADLHDMPPDHSSSPSRPSTRTAIVGLTAAGLAALAGVNHLLARKAERDNPPAGRFLNVNGVRLHYVERGRGEPVVLLHGNGSMIQDFQSSGLLDLAARKYRVIVLDRPGYGHSDRPRSRIWTPEAQADLIHDALAQLGIGRATILGHSWGCSVAVALAHKYPDLVGGLVLASGYYYPTARLDVVGTGVPAMAVLGDVLRYTISPALSRLMWPILMRKIFGPQAVPEKFAGFPKAMAVRPSQIRASAAESALMVPDALSDRETYSRLKMPVAIIAGAGVRLIDAEDQSARLHGDIPNSSLHRLLGAGHITRQTATEAVMSAIEKVAPSHGRSAQAKAA
ncbi:alpha/beta fold hydrolase [Paracoccus chinensis]|uniref:Pimeloyl-ACP methyl ester carboxylesterase n=1 Tax=Paracoccus chinensis TaxID=525640 RepID=A0A1G9NLM0_9RHOB|nr:alpha/beta hydrolase [Paracoccus chinensis]SDL87488.1 Pimeloyl-ACP methyl ester carboxylesterase [Paracoccus chinensis]